MSLTFPNRSRSYDEAGKRIRFVGHDGMFQISFSVAADAMTRMQPATAWRARGPSGSTTRRPP